MSSGSIGALLAHLTMGHIVHRLGVYKVLMYSSTATYTTLGLLIELHNPEIYMIINILCGFAWASYHIAINAQALELNKIANGIHLQPHKVIFRPTNRVKTYIIFALKPLNADIVLTILYG